MSEKIADGAINLTSAFVFPYLHLPSSEFLFGMLGNAFVTSMMLVSRVQGSSAKAKNQYRSSCFYNFMDDRDRLSCSFGFTGTLQSGGLPSLLTRYEPANINQQRPLSQRGTEHKMLLHE